MIARLCGTIHRLSQQEALLDVQGVGYHIQVPVDVWDTVTDQQECTIWTSTYVREDRLELYGFLDQSSRKLFELLIAQSGIGPKMGLELCAVPRELLIRAIEDNDTALLSTVKGVGKKKAEKLLIELKNVLDKQPEIFGSKGASGATASDTYDQDAIEALTALGYTTPTVIKVLQEIPKDLHTTEERVAAALRTL